MSKHNMTQVLIRNLARSQENFAIHSSTKLNAMEASIQKLAQYQFDMLDEVRLIREEVKDERKETNEEMKEIKEDMKEMKEEMKAMRKCLAKSIKKQDDPEAPKKTTQSKKVTPTKKRKRDEPVEHESSPVTKKAKK